MVYLLLDPNYLSLCMSFGGGVGLYSAGFEPDLYLSLNPKLGEWNRGFGPDLYSIFPFTYAIIHAHHDQFFSFIHPSILLFCLLSIYFICLSIDEQMHEWEHTGSRT